MDDNKEKGMPSPSYIVKLIDRFEEVWEAAESPMIEKFLNEEIGPPARD